jgi:hypothetical protein
MRKLLKILTLLTVAVVPVLAGPIQDIGLFNTGVDASGTVLPSGSDPHYTCAVVSGGGTACAGSAAVIATSGVGSWLAANSTSAWVAPIANVANISATVAQGTTTYLYTIAFDLSAYDLSTVTITGRWAADNYGSINVNSGSSFGSISDPGFSSWNAFTISSATSGITAGANTLKFTVVNVAGTGANFGANNPSGVRVEFTNFTGTLNEVIPEPGTLALLGGGLLAIGLFRRRR